MNTGANENHTDEQKKTSHLEKLSDRYDTDFYIYCGPLYRDEIANLVDSVNDNKNQKAKNGSLILSTYGGDADAAFVLAKAFKRNYEHFNLYVFGICKSAGTLVALGASEIIMAETAELGPLDVQHIKEDEIVSQSSGLNIKTGFDSIGNQAFNTFEHYFIELKRRSEGNITTKTAADIATQLTIGLFSPITSQIDPLKLGEIFRDLEIAFYYGIRLGAPIEVVHRLVFDYPSHSFVIDIEEAKELFQQSLRELDNDEKELKLDLERIFKSRYEKNLFVRPPFERAITVKFLKHNNNCQEENDEHLRSPGERDEKVPGGQVGPEVQAVRTDKANQADKTQKTENSKGSDKKVAATGRNGNSSG